MEKVQQIQLKGYKKMKNEIIKEFLAHQENEDMNNEFIDGIWFAVQHIVVVRDMPAIAIGIIKESNLSIDDCKAAQKRSGSFHNQMMKFIETELA